MRDRKVILYLILIMTAATLTIAGIAIRMLYKTAISEERVRLVETAQSQARLIEAIARFDSTHSKYDHPEGAHGATLSQVADAHNQYEGFGRTGEFTLARRDGLNMVFLLSHRHGDRASPEPVPFDSELAEPMRRSLMGLSGTVVGLDYRGVQVLAAHEPVAELNWGIVAKIDLAEIRAPFLRASIITGCAGVVVVLAGAVLFIRVSSPLIRRLEASEARTRAIVETAADGIITVSDTGLVDSFNRAGEQIFGYSADRVIGRNIRMLMSGAEEEDTDFPAGYLNNDGRQEAGSVACETLGRRKDGSVFPMDLAISEVHQANRRMFTVIVRDITERKASEEKLERLLVDLQRSNEELRQFAYVASHDLKEPLRMVASYTQLLEKRYRDKLDADARDFIHFAVDGATRMQTLIDDLLTYSRVGLRAGPFEATDCRAVLDQAISNLSAAVAENDAVITYDDLPTVTANGSQLTQLFQNLLGNSIKFRSEKAPRIHVSARRNGHDWLFSVRDNGIGIDPQYGERILLIFQRLHSRDKYPGTGIGLAICKKIVERHGGGIWFEGEPGKGSTFFFNIPTSESEA